MLTKPEQVDYSFTFRTKLVDKKGNNTFQDSRMVMTGQGKLQELVDAAKAAKEVQGNKQNKEEEAGKGDKKDKKKKDK